MQAEASNRQLGSHASVPPFSEPQILARLPAEVARLALVVTVDHSITAVGSTLHGGRAHEPRLELLDRPLAKTGH